VELAGDKDNSTLGGQKDVAKDVGSASEMM
jgi:hypothetical protein